MSAHAGISRNGPDLAAGLEKVQAIRERAERAAAPGGRAYNPGWHAVLDVQNMALLSEAIVRCAILRRESRGAHWRTDFPEADPELGKVNFIAQADGDTMRIDTAPVPEMPEELAAMFRAGVAPGAEAVPAAASGGKGGN
jgi:succinate dehydrogenase / fumarate reductase flavoprotein subunit